MADYKDVPMTEIPGYFIPDFGNFAAGVDMAG
jgi:hypothetical protein